MFSSAHLEKLGSQFKVALGLRGKGESAFGMVAETVAEGALMFGMSYANGRFAEPGKQAVEIGGVPLDLAGGTILQLGALIGFFGQYGNAAHIVGKAVTAPYICRQGQMMGVNHRVAKAATTTKGAFAPPPVAAGFFPAVAGPVPAYATPQAAPAVMGAWGAV